MKGSCTLVASVLAASTVALGSSSSSAGDRDASIHPCSNEVQLQFSNFLFFLIFKILMQIQTLLSVPWNTQFVVLFFCLFFLWFCVCNCDLFMKKDTRFCFHCILKSLFINGFCLLKLSFWKFHAKSQPFRFSFKYPVLVLLFFGCLLRKSMICVW